LGIHNLIIGRWRNRDLFLNGREEVKEFLKNKWKKEQGYKLRKELFCFTDNRIAVHFEYEWHNEKGEVSPSGFKDPTSSFKLIDLILNIDFHSGSAAMVMNTGTSMKMG
jgi:hypothetical protein